MTLPLANWRLSVSLCACLIAYQPGFAQDVDSAQHQLIANLQASGMEMLFPTEAGFRPQPVRPYTPEQYDYAMFSKQEALEFRVRAIPEDPANPVSLQPHLMAVRACRSAASNAPDEVITQLSLGTKELNAYRADWGVEFIFRPKPGFSAKQYAKLIVVYREGAGTGFLYLLSDKANNPALDNWANLFRFKH
jgi:hypothetical protein